MRAALEELVDCKNLKDQIDATHWREVGTNAHHVMLNEYERRKPLAWAAARTAITRAEHPGEIHE